MKQKINVDDLTLIEKIGQKIMIGIEGNKITDRTKRMILKYKIGGVILYRDNYVSYEELLNIINELKELNSKNKIPLFISVDQEGGRVNRMPLEFKNLASASKISSSKNIEVVKSSAKITGKMLRQSGFNMDFSPVLDIKRFELNHAIGDRCYGENKEEVSKFGIQVMKTLQEENIIPVIKHFPGHGATRIDSHLFLPSVKSIDLLEKEDFIPFIKAIEDGADAMMISHIIVKDVNKTYPASLSKEFIQKYVREKYKFNGVIITDDLKMRAVRYIYGKSYSVRRAFEVGNDIIMFRFGRISEELAIMNVINRISKGKIDINMIDKSVERILKLKEKYNLDDKEKIKGCNVAKINKEIEDINNIVNV